MSVSKLLYNVRLAEGNSGFQAVRRKQSTGFPEVLCACTDFDWNDMWLQNLHLSRAVVSMPCDGQWMVGNSHAFV